MQVLHLRRSYLECLASAESLAKIKVYVYYLVKVLGALLMGFLDLAP